LGAYRLGTRTWKLLDTLTPIFFAAHFLITVAAGSDLLTPYGGPLSYGVLAAMAWGSLAGGSPFMYQYIRDDHPQEFWSDPLFRQTNRILTVARAVVFTLCLVISWIAPAGWATVSLLVFGAVFTAVFSEWFPRRVLARQVKAFHDPYGTPAPTFPTVRPSRADEYDVVVVGAGMGGLTAGALLSQRGLKVLVVEQAAYVGGFCATFRRMHRQYVFDVGVHDISGLGPGGTINRVLRQLGLEEKLQMAPMSHHYILPGARLAVPHDAGELVTALCKLFPAEQAGIERFFREMTCFYRELYGDVESTGGIPQVPKTASGMLRYPKDKPHVYRWMEKGYVEMLDAFFQDATLKRLLCSLTGYLTDRPESLTVMQMAPLFGYYLDGGWYPRGGSGAIAELLAKAIEDAGGTILLRRQVTRIAVDRGAVQQVQLADGTAYRTRAVVANADPVQTFVRLIGPEHLPEGFLATIQALQPSTSVVEVYLGLDCDPAIAPMTVLHAPDGTMLYLMTPSKVDPTLAPPGHHVLTILALVSQPEASGWSRSDPDYGGLKQSVAERLIAQVETILPDLREHVVTMDVATPATVKRYTGHPDGAIYGMSLNGEGLPQQTPIAGLYLAGASTWPGPGVEAAVISGVYAADAIFSGKRLAQPVTDEAARSA
jgi:all-trans-retinol 13,14-reductase